MRYKRRDYTDLIVVHCAATPPRLDIGVEEIREWHVARGFQDVGYSYVIRRNGEVEPGRPEWAEGAHVAGSNHRSVGICLVGGVNEHRHRPEFNFTIDQMRTLEALIGTLLEHYPGARVMGHRDIPNVMKACPCFDVESWWDQEHAA